MFVSGFVRFETVDALGNKGRRSQAGERLAEPGTRSQSVTTCVLGDLRFASNADRSQSLRLNAVARAWVAPNLLI